MGTTKSRTLFTLTVVFGINLMNFYDRQVGAAVQEQLKNEWGASDKILGSLGSAFIILYAFFGLPFGRLADTSQRKLILAAGVAVWSLLTFGSGFAVGFVSLFILRLLVGVGEATCAPAANSLIGDLVPPERRSRALSVFMIGLPLGLALGSFVSGWIVRSTGRWQTPFFVAGVPGFLLAIAALFMTEPPRGAADARAHAAPREHQSFFQVARIVLGLPTIWWIIASGALHNFNMYAIGQWLGSFLQRYHEVGPKEANQVVALGQAAGILPLFIIGWLGDRAFRRGVSGRLHVAWITVALTVPCLFLTLAAPRGELWWSAVWLVPAYGLLFAYYGTVYATIQDIIEPHFRGLAMAIYFFAMYLFGGVLGPSVPGMISDRIGGQVAAADGWLAAHSAAGAAIGPAATARFDLYFARRASAIGLHDALYMVPVFDAILVLVLIAATFTVNGDYQRRLRREEEAAAAATRAGAISPAPALETSR
jgi:MFS family permease